MRRYTHVSLRESYQIPQIMGTNTQKFIHSVKLHISHQMKPCSSLKSIWGSIYTCSSVFVIIGASRRNLAKIAQIMGRDTQKVMQSVKFQISRQMKPYSSVKTICVSSYTCFSIFGELGQVAEIGPKYPKSWALIHRKSLIVLNSKFHIKWSYTHLKSIRGSIYTYSC